MKKKIFYLILCVLGVAVLLYGFIKLPQKNHKTKCSEHKMKIKVVSSHNDFAFRLFKELSVQEPSNNLFISPLGISLLLQISSIGSEGKTEKQLKQVLAIQNMSNETLNTNNAKLLNYLNSPKPPTKLEIANSLWLKKDLIFKEEYTKTCKDYYLAEIYSIDEKAVEKINKWGNDKTNGIIPQIIDKIDPNEVCIFLNAVYFKSQWMDEFQKYPDSEEKFTTIKGEKKKVEMMCQGGDYYCYEDSVIQAIKLPYKDGLTSMYIFLPRENINFNNFVSNFTEEKWTDYLNKFQERDARIDMPLFSYNTSYDLNSALKNIGVIDAFNPEKADFGKISDEPIFISKFQQSAFIKVDEKGTEAAAITYSSLEITCSTENEKFEMIVNHPFLFLIVDDQTGCILFMGSLVDPPESE